MSQIGANSWLVALVVFAFGAAGESVLAETAATGADEVVEEIIVTARRREERLVDTPVAIAALDGQTMEEYQVDEITDLASLIPGMVTGKAASGSSASIFLRGVGSTALSAGFDQSVSFLVDGIPMSRGREVSLPQFDVQRVEVLKGPQSLFYGKNTTGGLISIVSNGPTDTFESRVNAGYGFEADEFYVDGFVSGPLSETVRARLAVRYSDSDGAFDNTASNNYPSPAVDALTFAPLGFVRNPNASNRGFAESLGARLTVDWAATDRLTFEFKAGYNKFEDGGPTDILERLCGAGRTTPQPSVPFAGFVVPASPNTDCRINGKADSASIPVQIAQTDYRFAGNGDLYAEFESDYYVVKAEYGADQFDIVSVTSLYSFEQPDLNNVSGESYPGNFSQYAEFDQLTQEIRLQTEFDGMFNFMFGAFFSDSEFDFRTDAYIIPLSNPIPGGAFVTFKRDNGFENDSWSVFTDLSFTLTDELELTVGARYSDEERTSFQRSISANAALVAEFPPGSGTFVPTFPGGVFIEDDFNDDDLSPQVTLRYKPDEDTTFYAAYREGFKTGGFNISQALTLVAGLNPAGAIATGQYESETAKGGEIGVRAIRLGGKLTANATIYSYIYEDLQVQVFDPTSISLIADNAGELQTQGVEIDVNWLATDVLSLRAALAYNDAEYDNFIGACFEGQTIAQGCAFNPDPISGAFTSQDYGGRTPPKAPEWGFRGGFTLEFPLDDLGGRLELLADASYTSDYNFTDTLRFDAEQDSFWKVDASIRFVSQDERWHVALIGRNLGDELVVTAANDIPFTGGVSQGTGTTSGTVSDMSAFVNHRREVFLEFGLRL